jgi:peptide chain release factor 2
MVEQHGTASISLGDVPTAYVSAGSLNAERPTHVQAEGPARLSVETLRRFGGISPRALLGGEFDDHAAILEIHAGEGGTDSQDWADMLLRMYLRWGENRGFKTELVDQ